MNEKTLFPIQVSLYPSEILLVVCQHLLEALQHKLVSLRLKKQTKQKTVILLPFQATLYKHLRLLPRLIDMGPFLERPGNFSGPKANFHQNQNLLNSGTVPRSQTSQFYFIVNS